MSSRGLLVLYLLKGGRRLQGSHPHDNMEKNTFNSFVLVKLIGLFYSPSFDGIAFSEVSGVVALLLPCLFIMRRLIII